jgi:protein TonB
MERRLFEGFVASRTARGRARRAGMLPISLVVHAVVLGLVLGTQILTPDVLPQLTTSADDLTIPAVLVPAPPPRRGVPPSEATRRGARAAEPAPAGAPVVAMPTPWSELPPTGDPSWGLVDVPVCEGCVPWGVDDGVPGPDAPAPAVVPPAPVLRPGGLVEPPVKVRHVAPKYPELARTTGVEGTVIVECRVDVDGRVADTRVLRGHPLLNEAALEAVQQWAYRPTLLNGRPVAVLMTVTVRFQLH